MTEIVVRNVAASAAWYERSLGMTVARVDGARFILLEALGGRLALKQGEPQPAGVKLHFEADALPPGADVKASDEGYRRIVLADPDGYAVVVFAWDAELRKTGADV